MSVLYEGGADWGLDGNPLINQNNTSGVVNKGLSLESLGLGSRVMNNGELPSISKDILSSIQADYTIKNPGAPTRWAAGMQSATNSSGNQESGMFGGLGSYMDKLGVTGPEGQLFGLSKDQQQSLGDLAGLGSGVWNMYNANRQYDMMKDYYGKQMELQDKQMARVDKEDARMEGMRSGLAKNY